MGVVECRVIKIAIFDQYLALSRKRRKTGRRWSSTENNNNNHSCYICSANRNSYAIFEWYHFRWPWTTPNPIFQGRAIIWRWISQKRYEIETYYNGLYTDTDLHTPYSRVSFRMTLSDLAKYIHWHEASRGLSATAELLVKVLSKSLMHSSSTSNLCSLFSVLFKRLILR